VLKCIALIFVSSNIHAATVDLTNKNRLPPSSSLLPSLDKKKTRMTFLNENTDNTFLQGSLLAFTKARKLPNETESILNKPTQHILLELEPYNQLEPLLLEKNNTPENFSYDNPQKNNTSRNFNYINQQENYSLAAYDQYITDDETESSLLKEILRIKSLYYIFALIIIAAFFKWILTLLLLGKYK